MDVTHEEELRTEFRKILYDLSQSQNILQDASGKKKRSSFYQELERLYYTEGFQHFTSDIFIVLKNIHQDSSKGSIDVLGQNLEWMRRKYQKKKDSNGETKDIESNIQKLYDDVNLEISRILTDEADAWKYSQERKINQLDRKIEESQNKLVKVEKKIESSQKEYIAILGIFAAIILAFTGGITFSTSVLENLHKSSIYRVTLVVLLIGFTLVNILYLLFMFIDKLVRDDKRVIPISPLITFDISVIAFVIIVIVLWSTGFVEGRNQNVNAALSQENSFTSEIKDPTKEDEESSGFELKNQS
ncbi:MAG: hypothetical protein HDT42_11425 [Ruminococcaceae bacterium]|nr:hypothetical protein [Oscillospiraceae bacterium]